MPNGPIYPERRSFSPKNWGWEDLIYNAITDAYIFETSSHHQDEDVIRVNQES